MIKSLLFGGLLVAAAGLAKAATVECDPAHPPPATNPNTPPPAQPPDLLVKAECHISGGTFYFGDVNIIRNGRLIFADPTYNAPLIHFWAKSILIENGGALIAGTRDQPFGKNRSLTIHLYGPDQSGGNPRQNPGLGILCKSPEDANTGPCGIPMSAWKDNGTSDNLNIPEGSPTSVKDYFYRYGPLRGDEKCSDGNRWSSNSPCDERKDQQKTIPSTVKVGYFGYKVLAVSYGGTLQLNGWKGSCLGLTKGCDDITTHLGWGRLESSIAAGSDINKTPIVTHLGVISPGDEMVVTTTDYLPGHSESFVIRGITSPGGPLSLYVDHPPQWPHNGERFPLKNRLAAAGDRLKLDPDLIANGAETRAAVASLTRSIRIVSGGDKPGDEFPGPNEKDPRSYCAKTGAREACYSFGGHTIFRQGFAKVEVVGVEFKQLGQGGRIGHYPIHFHMARKTPAGTIVRDSSINESMTRWIVLHSTQGVTLAGNIGYKSIGHGFYLEDGTETDNQLVGNLGIFARAAVDDDQNPRKIPGILADNTDPDKYDKAPYSPARGQIPGFRYRSDAEYPTVFWITNGWNDFRGNMAAGAGTCGSCYWFVPTANSDMVEVPNPKTGGGRNMSNATTARGMKWSGYSALQKNRDYAGATPLKSFYGNHCTSAMMSFQTTPDAPKCFGVIAADEATPPAGPALRAVRSLAGEPARKRDDKAPATDPGILDPLGDMYYPHIEGERRATVCRLAQGAGSPTYNCDNVKVCSAERLENCAVTVLDHYTTSFNWAAGAVSAVWLRRQWYLVDNSVFSDVQNAGLTFITGGDFTHSSVIPGYWGLARNSVFIGHTQPQDEKHAFSLDKGPFNGWSKRQCDGPGVPNWCVNKEEGVSMPISEWFANQRLFNIYDGPGYQESNAYLDITKTPCLKGLPVDDARYCMYSRGTSFGVVTEPAAPSNCYLANAAIAWKQPNGFFYPPAFHSANLYFNNVDIRHYVIDPLFKSDGAPYPYPTGYITNFEDAKKVYCFPNDALFSNWTGIDRQTELNDDDGTLTGLSNSLPGSPSANPLKQTISVNEDPFFTAPVETPECWSNVGKNSSPSPSSACSKPTATEPPVTARTSPYDYVATVVYHPTVLPPAPRPADWKPEWEQDCTHPGCYGVPLYRQFLAGTKDKPGAREWRVWYDSKCDQNQNQKGCRWPFIRMAGASISTRETLTVNNGLYYLDTTVPYEMQRDEAFNQLGGYFPVEKRWKSKTASFNVFKAGETYTVFFLYVKPQTRQSYQIYVGKGSPSADLVKAVQVGIADLNFNQRIKILDQKPSWLEIDDKAVQSTGIVTVSLDFTKASNATKKSLAPIPGNGLCQPASFCKPDGDRCTGNLKDSDPLVQVDKKLQIEANEICARWAVKDLDCPKDGCFGFQFKLLPSFVADATPGNPSPHRPPPQPFPSVAKTDANWPQFERSKLAPDSQNSTDPRSCFYEKLPTSTVSNPAEECSVP